MLDLARPGVHEPAVIDDYKRHRDEPPNRGRPANPSVFADPQQGGDEGHGVGREMATRRAAREVFVAENTGPGTTSTKERSRALAISADGPPSMSPRYEKPRPGPARPTGIR